MGLPPWVMGVLGSVFVLSLVGAGCVLYLVYVLCIMADDPSRG